MNLSTKALLTALALTATGAAAENITISIENTMGDDSFFFTPFWIGVHDGSFDTYNGGESSSIEMTNLAEIGNTAPLSDLFSASAAGLAGGVQTTATAVASAGDAPVFSPGESTVFNLDIGDSTINRYFSYASMVVPSNDLFIANGNPMAHMIFDAAGNFTGPVVIEIYGREVNDNGTEVNSAVNDAAFSTNDGQALPESVFIRDFFTNPDDTGYLDSFLGSTTANGATIGATFGADDLIARITITPAPSSIAMLGGLGLVGLRRRR
ncbi:MAG: spondin domain-containing protein [Phycisphaerales bacterium]|nr:spondin domain-containing protein [Phycisphaerales bacterium]